MQEIFERVQKVVSSYNPRQANAQLKAAKALSPAVAACRKYIRDNSQSDRGCAERIARELDEILIGMPEFRHFVGDKQAIASRHTRKLAEEHLDQIQDYLKSLLSVEEQDRKQQITDWVASHPVFGELHHICCKKAIPKDTYVLLFRESQSGTPSMVTKTTPDGLVITRFKPRDFVEEQRIYKTYHSARGGAIVGAAVIAERQFVAALGRLPEAAEGKDQLQVVLSLSKAAASKPAQEFLQRNPVLKQLHDLSRKREIPKDAYVLLLKRAVDIGSCTLLETDDESAADEAPAEQSMEETAEHAAEVHTPEVAEETAETQVAQESLLEPEVAQESPEPAVAEESPEPAVPQETEQQSPEETTKEPDAEEQQSPESGAELAAAESLTIVVKSENDNKIITRFWPQDFAREYVVFETFKKAPPVVGAAVIHQGELAQAIGRLPQPAEGETQLKAVLGLSNQAVEKPAQEFLQGNDVLKQLHELCRNSKFENPYVLLFMETASGGIQLVTGHKQQARIPLADFQSPKFIFDRYGKLGVVGASVVSGEKPRETHNGKPPFRKHEGKPRNGDREGKPRFGEREDNSKPSVVAAFGRTPLKASLLATPENFRRMGLNV